MTKTEPYLARNVDQHVKPIRWIASLSNGETIFEDQKSGEISAWERLRSYVIDNKLAITRLRIQLNHLEVTLPAKAEGYVQKKKFVSTGGWSQLQYCIGHIENGMCLLHYVSEDGSSVSEIVPVQPSFAIYDHTNGCQRECCDASASS
jgi:hypothetical protein